MADSADLLFELGTEELPPTALKRLSDAFTNEFTLGLEKAGLGFGEITPFATPRRLAVLVKACALAQPDRQTERRGPSVQAAFNADGTATKAAEGFARSCKTSVDRLTRVTSDKGEWLAFRLEEKGKAAADLLPGIAEQALNRLPIPKRMRWGDSSALFIRPVHWLLFLHGEQVVPCTLLDATADRYTQGHRFHHPAPIQIDDPSQYAKVLEVEGKVIAHFHARRERIETQVKQVAETIGGRAEIDPELLDEVTGLVEWPVPISAGFEQRFLQVPHEALILSMKKNQKYFHLVDRQGRLMNHFVTIANIDSPTPEVIKEGNERVIRPRLSDAMFFWQQDGKRRLDTHRESLKSVVFQQKLGSMYDKSARVARLADEIAAAIGGDRALATRAGELSRCDLMTEMVVEFPEMQGVMGRYQALRDGESEELAQAMDEFYMPRFSGDELPRSQTGIAIALAERLDTLVGIFGIGQHPTGDKDPFALRRAALGALRILKERSLPLSLSSLLKSAAVGLAGQLENQETVAEVYDFMLERLKGIYLDKNVPVNLFEAVATVHPETLADFDRRVNAVIAFEQLPEAEALAAANKRIRNILRKSEDKPADNIDPQQFDSDEERALHRQIIEKSEQVKPLLASFDYEGALKVLAELREPVDRFFDQVMVMVDNPRIRGNRLALLDQMHRLFLGVADVSKV